MSERQPFPEEQSVSNAYLDVLLANQSMEHDAIELDALQDELGPLSKEAKRLLEKFVPDYRREEETENGHIETLTTRYGQLFGTIGVNLCIEDSSDSLTNVQLADTKHIVPELNKPARFADYLGHIGCHAVYGDPVHRQLAEDVIEHILATVKKNDNGIAYFQEKSPDSVKFEVATLQNIQNEYLSNFRIIMPFYFNANFQHSMPAYRELEKRVLAKPDGSL